MFLLISVVSCQNRFTYDSSTNTMTIDADSTYNYNTQEFRDCITSIESSSINVIIRGSLQQIPQHAFYNFKKYIQNLKIEAEITEIKNFAFKGANIIKFIANKNLNSIGVEAFAGSGLTEFQYRSSIVTYNDRAFYNCEKLEKFIQVPGDDTVILEGWAILFGKSLFEGCYKLTTVTLPKDTKYLSENSMFLSSGITSLEIPKGVNLITTNCFKDTLLASINLRGIKYVSGYAFANCQYLKTVDFGNDLESIFGNAFMNCKKLTQIRLSPKVVTISDYAFAECSSLTTVDLANVIDINQYSFYKCVQLSSITMEKAKSIHDSAFYGCAFTNLNLRSAIKYIGNKAFGNNPNLETVEIESSNRLNISDLVFQNSNKLQQIVFKAYFSYVSPAALDSTPSLKKIIYCGEEDISTLLNPHNPALEIDVTTEYDSSTFGGVYVRKTTLQQCIIPISPIPPSSASQNPQSETLPPPRYVEMDNSKAIVTVATVFTIIFLLIGVVGFLLFWYRKKIFRKEELSPDEQNILKVTLV